MYLKTAILLLWFGGSYTCLVFEASSVWQLVVFSISLGLAAAGIGFGVQHDANHGAYSAHEAVNRLLGLTLDLMGGSSYLWRWKHSVFHHTYTNISGADDDIDLQPFARLAPAQPHRRWHRLQHVYVWALYGLLAPKWHFIDDFKSVIDGRIACHGFPRPKNWRLVELLAGKLVFLGWALGIPLLLHRWWVVLVGYAATSLVVGMTLSLVFQLAHCVEEAAFSSSAMAQTAKPWAVHQVESTVDFAPTNALLTWYLGGLNYQIEHHLFPRICHIHYPRIAAIVKSVSLEFGVRYTSAPSVAAALASHGRWLRRMGRPTPASF